MTADELTAWAKAQGWRERGGYLSLAKPSAPRGAPGHEAVIRLVLKATVAQLEAKKPAGKWEKLASLAYAKILPDPESGAPMGLGLDTTSIRALMQDNRDRQVFGG